MAIRIQLPFGQQKSKTFFSLLLMITNHLLVAYDFSGQHFTRLWWYDIKNNNNGSILNPVQLGPFTTPPSSQLRSFVTPSSTWSHSNSFNNDDKLISTQNLAKENIKYNNYITPNPDLGEYIGPTDDELMTQASKLGSHMTRIMAPSSVLSTRQEMKIHSKYEPLLVESSNSGIVSKNSATFDDENELSQHINIENKETETKYFDNQEKLSASHSRPFFTNQPFNGFHHHQQQRNINFPINSYSDRIWSFFDSNINRGMDQRPKSWKTFGLNDSTSINGIVDSYIEKLVKRNQSNLRNSKPATMKDQEKQQNILRLNLNRRKNPEEKEKFRQLIQNIFDSTPRKTYSYGSDNGYSKMNVNVDGAGEMDQQESENGEDDRLKEEKEENVVLKETNEDIVDDIVLNENENLNDGEENELVQGKEDLNRKEQPIESEESDDEDNEEDENNQYLKQRVKKNNTRMDEDFSYGNRISSNSVTNELSGQLQKRDHHRINLIAPAKKKSLFRANFNRSGSSNSKSSVLLLSTTTTENTFSLNDLTTMAPYTSTPLTEMEESLDLSNEDLVGFDDLSSNNNSNSKENTTESEEDLKSLLITKRKQQRVGKWMDAETFEFKNDDEDDGDDFDESNVNQHHTNNAIQINFKPIVRSSTRPASIKPISSPRFTRQNTNLIQQDDNFAQLARNLPGVPGQDYPVFGSIPRTRFNCKDHKWPGYYADMETQCQVFHICQTGGRKNSFLCPNGTMFNQQLFICDWWHNVQCDEVSSHYELNAHIYDLNWESNRLQKSSPKFQPIRMSIRRMAVLEDVEKSDNDNDNSNGEDSTQNKSKRKNLSNDSNSLMPSTEQISRSFNNNVNQTLINTTESTPLSLTKSIFGVRNRPLVTNEKSNDKKVLSLLKQDREQQQEKKQSRKFITSTKGGNSLINGETSKFSRLIQMEKNKSNVVSFQKSPQTNIGTKFTHHKFSHQSQLTKTTPLPELLSNNFKSTRFQMTPATVRMSTRPGKYYRT